MCGCWPWVTDWTDGAVGGCVEVTGFISIWVKNLANVANTVGWVRGERTGAQTIPRVCVCVCVGWLVGQ